MDIRDRLKKLADLVRYDEEARTTCEDAIKEFDRLMPAGNAGVAANAASSGPWTYTAFRGPPPPSQTTHVKMESPYTRLFEAISKWKLDANPESPYTLHHFSKPTRAD